jgi:uncharacterized protein
VSASEKSRQKGRLFRILSSSYVICRFAPDQDVPPWAFRRGSEFVSVTRSRNELSVICAARALPRERREDRPWRCLRIEDSSGLDEPGVLASAVVPLANAGISVFAIATYDTDYLLVADLDGAVAALRSAGHEVAPD